MKFSRIINLYFIVLFLTCSSLQAKASYLLKAPETYMEESSRPQGFSMNFRNHDKLNNIVLHYRFQYQEGQTYVIVQFEGKLPKGLTLREIQKLEKSIDGNKAVWSFIYPAPSSLTLKKDLVHIETLEKGMGLVEQSLKVIHANPRKISVAGLLKKVKNKHVVFYTGAGISAKTVPTMDILVHNLQIRKGESMLPILKKAMQNPQAPLNFMDEFNKKCLNAQPTQAHYAIKKIVKAKNWGLLTENLDKLHQKTGILPLNHSFENWLEKYVSTDAYKKIDVVVTIGLRSDESGFLKKYKELHPGGIIIAIDLAQPDYLGNSDFLVCGDCQEVVPQLSKEVGL